MYVIITFPKIYKWNLKNTNGIDLNIFNDDEITLSFEIENEEENYSSSFIDEEIISNSIFSNNEEIWREIYSSILNNEASNRRHLG